METTKNNTKEFPNKEAFVGKLKSMADDIKSYLDTPFITTLLSDDEIGQVELIHEKLEETAKIVSDKYDVFTGKHNDDSEIFDTKPSSDKISEAYLICTVFDVVEKMAYLKARPRIANVIEELMTNYVNIRDNVQNHLISTDNTPGGMTAGRLEKLMEWVDKIFSAQHFNENEYRLYYYRVQKLAEVRYNLK